MKLKHFRRNTLKELYSRRKNATVRDWFEKHPDDKIRDKLLRNINRRSSLRIANSFSDAVFSGFNWSTTPEGGIYWQKFRAEIDEFQK